jgi:hypothetical protein
MSCFLQFGIVFVDPRHIIGFQVRWEGAKDYGFQYAVVVYAGAHALVCSNHESCEVAQAFMHMYIRQVLAATTLPAPTNNE